jgi:hypothetical protein
MKRENILYFMKNSEKFQAGGPFCGCAEGATGGN